MAYIVSDLQTQVQNRLTDSSYSTGNILQFLNNINRRLVNGHRFRAMGSTQTLTSTIGSISLSSLNANVQTPINLRLSSPVNYATDLPYMEYEDFDNMYPVPSLTANSVPIVWSIFAGVPFIFPQADAVYTFTLRYLKKPTLLVNASDVPDVPEEFQELLVLGAWAQALESKDYIDESQVVWNQFYMLEAQMTQRLANRQLGQPVIMKGSRYR